MKFVVNTLSKTASCVPMAAGTALAYGAYNIFFAGSKLKSDQPFFAQVSLHAINNRTIPQP